jgi:hypothetical protein
VAQEANVATACLLSHGCVWKLQGAQAVWHLFQIVALSMSPALSLSGGLLSRALVPGGGVMGAAGRNAAHVVFRDLKNM